MKTGGQPIMIKEGESFVYPNAFAPLLSFTQQRARVPQNDRMSHQPPLVARNFSGNQASVSS